MKKRTALLISTLFIGAIFCAAKTKNTPVWTDAKVASKEVTHFSMIGEYISLSGKTALQANLLKDDFFLVAIYQKGLPGAGWVHSAIESKKWTAAELKQNLKEYKKVERVSPTEGKPAPKNAILTFPSDFTNVKNGLLLAGGETKKELASFQMHLEFLMPLKPDVNPSNQKRGNSGIYIYNNYEVQVIDSFALDLNMENNAIKTDSKNTRWCGALYKMKAPAINMTYPPLRWQTYDIVFEAPIFKNDKKVKTARITVIHNGIKIQDRLELKTGTGVGANRKQLAKGLIFFQNHDNPVVYRNIWATIPK